MLAKGRCEPGAPLAVSPKSYKARSNFPSFTVLEAAQSHLDMKRLQRVQEWTPKKIKRTHTRERIGVKRALQRQRRTSVNPNSRSSPTKALTKLHPSLQRHVNWCMGLPVAGLPDLCPQSIQVSISPSSMQTCHERSLSRVPVIKLVRRLSHAWFHPALGPVNSYKHPGLSQSCLCQQPQAPKLQTKL